MGKWWSSSAIDRGGVRTLLAIALTLALAGCRGHDRAPADDSVPAVVDDVPSGTLPAPEAAPGTSVTGMPTTPPPPAAVTAEAVAAASQEDAGAALPAPVDVATTPDTETPSATDDTATPGSPAPPPPSPADAAAAASLLTQYMAALGAGAPARGQALWSTTPNDSTVTQLARNAPFDVGVGAVASDAGGRISVPVDVRGKADDGSDRHVVATYTVQRNATGSWRIMSATVRDAAP